MRWCSIGSAEHAIADTKMAVGWQSGMDNAVDWSELSKSHESDVTA